MPVSGQKRNLVNLMEKFKPAGIPVSNLEGELLISLTGADYKLAAISHDFKFIAVSRSYTRKENEIMDIVLIKLKNNKETVVLDTQTMIRYGRPHGFLYNLQFNNQDQLIAKISDGMKGTSVLTIDTEKKEILKDEYLDDVFEDEEEGEEEIYLDRKMADMKRIFPKKNNIELTELAYKLLPVDTFGYFIQSALPGDNSIFYLRHGEGKLRLIHNISDPSMNDNIDGIWGNADVAYYLLKDKKFNYLFKYDIKLNMITLMEKFPPHSHFSYIYSYPLKNNEVLLSFEVENNSLEINETLKLFKCSGGMLFKIDDYPLLQDITYLNDQNILLLYYSKNGKRCLDIRNFNQ